MRRDKKTARISFVRKSKKQSPGDPLLGVSPTSIEDPVW